jgi:hypothetical protein
MFPHNLENTLVYGTSVESYGVTLVSPPTQPTKSKKSTSSAAKLDSPAKKKSVPNKLESLPKKSEAAKRTSGVQKELTLPDLPFEMLEKIFKMLDSFR